MEYNPDVWVVFKVVNPSYKKPIYKVFAGWYGGYAGSDSWKMNSGITKVEEGEHTYSFHGCSGSTYVVPKAKQCYRMSGYMASVWANFMEKLKDSDTTFEVLDENTDWFSLEYEYEKV